jgi:AAHS family 4-hydroxybenzoate transporter-like MFS transporter
MDAIAMSTPLKPITVSEVLDQLPLSRLQIWTLTFCTIVAIFVGVDGQSIGFLAPAIAGSMNIDVKTFAPVFSVALFGLMIGALAVGPIADIWGRKWPLVGATILFAVCSALTPIATSFDQLLVFRFLTGIGLGGAMPHVVSLANEFSPKRFATISVTLLACGIPFGTFLAGMAATVMVPMWGWQSIFYMGALLPIALSLAMIALLPESVRFLILRSPNRTRVSNMMEKISNGAIDLSDREFVSDEKSYSGFPVKHLFTEGRAIPTVLLWVMFVMNLMILWAIVSWFPALLREASMPLSAGIWAISLFSLGGALGSVLQGPWMNRYGQARVILIEFAFYIVFVVVLAYIPVTFAIIMAFSFLIGISCQGAEAGLNALAAESYPTLMRSSGVGWALGVGRIGSITGPILGGLMLSLQWDLHKIFLAGTIPAVLSLVALVLWSRSKPKH